MEVLQACFVPYGRKVTMYLSSHERKVQRADIPHRQAHCRADPPVRVISFCISTEKGRQRRASHCIGNITRQEAKGNWDGDIAASAHSQISI